MQKKFVRLAAAALAVALLAASCAGGETPTTDAVAAAPDNEQAPIVGAIPTTPPVQLETTSDDDAEADEPTAQLDTPLELEEEVDQWEVTVLTVKDDTQIVPTFDAPNGNNVKIYDVNQIDGVELEYPLYAQTAFGNRLALVVEQFDDTGAWAEVGVPVRPNGTTTWIQTAFFNESTHNYHITVDLSENSVNVYQGTSF